MKSRKTLSACTDKRAKQNPDLTRRKKSDFSCFFGFFGYNRREVYFDNTRYEPTALSICILSDQTF